ncbi:MAG: hypothetical protein WB622_00130 [Acidobacteriaceae bacterium]|jgi:hypothetical protein
MQNQVPNSPMPPVSRGRCGSTSSILFALGVVLTCFGGAIMGDYHWNMVGLGLLVFSSLVHLD